MMILRYFEAGRPFFKLMIPVDFEVLAMLVSRNPLRWQTWSATHQNDLGGWHPNQATENPTGKFVLAFPRDLKAESSFHHLCRMAIFTRKMDLKIVIVVYFTNLPPYTWLRLPNFQEMKPQSTVGSLSLLSPSTRPRISRWPWVSLIL